MGVVVDSDEGTAVAGRTDNAPLRSTAVDRTSSMSLLNSDDNVACAEVAFIQSFDCMLRPKEADEVPRRATGSD
jgi:hypothetical protein